MIKKVLILIVFVISLSIGGSPVLAADMLDKVAVVVNDEVVTQREFERAFLPIKKSYETNFQGEELEARLEDAEKALLEQIINIKLAISLARQQKLEVDEVEVQNRIDKVKSFYTTEDEFLKALEERGTNLTEFRKEISEQMMAQQIVDKEVASKIVITPSEINELYEKNRDKLIAPKTVKLYGIMVRKTDDEAAGKKKINDVKTALDSGKDFQEVARTMSEGPYASNGGDMGKVVQGQLLEEMDQAIFNTDQGKTTDIVETKIGYHIFKIDKIEEPRPLGLKEVSDFLKAQLYKKKFTEDLKAWVDEKRKNAYISYK